MDEIYNRCKFNDGKITSSAKAKHNIVNQCQKKTNENDNQRGKKTKKR
jgi:hypothetical protein